MLSTTTARKGHAMQKASWAQTVEQYLRAGAAADGPARIVPNVRPVVHTLNGPTVEDERESRRREASQAKEARAERTARFTALGLI